MVDVGVLPDDVLAACMLAKGGSRKSYHTAVRDKTEKVKATIAVLCSLKGLCNVLDLVELLLLDGLIYPNNLCEYRVSVFEQSLERDA